ncbi:hypothetical protein [Bifidobacterium adolescentis]|uniref:hypothetical protein n=1 Tax=Bifidobacterium adolescentis TaxID=1680 RepID=UPI0034A2FD1C
MTDFKIVPLMHSRDYSFTFGLRNMDMLETLLSNGWRVVRAAVAMFRLDTNWASDDPTDAEVADWWDKRPDAVRDGYLRRARAALEAAR